LAVWYMCACVCLSATISARVSVMQPKRRLRAYILGASRLARANVVGENDAYIEVC
jgi:hypothetical protein